MSNNVIDFASKLLAKQEQEEQSVEDLHGFSSGIANDILNMLRDEYDIPIDDIEFSPEVIYFFEAFKSLIFKAYDLPHPFQEFAEHFFHMYGITITEDQNGNYKFIIGGSDTETEPEPANDG